MSDELYRLKTYTADMDFLFSTYIREYDISKANINILLYKEMINKEEYQKLYNAPRMYRQKSIGYLLKDKQYCEDKNEAITLIQNYFSSKITKALTKYIVYNNRDLENIESFLNLIK